MDPLAKYISAHAGTHPRVDIDQALRAAGHSEAAILAGWNAAMNPVVPVSGPPGFAGTDALRSPLLRIVIVVVAVSVGLMGGLQQWRADSESSTSKPSAVKTDPAFLGTDGESPGALPAGWSKVRNGMWHDGDTPNNVGIVRVPLEGQTFEDVYLAEAGALIDTPGMTLLGEPMVEDVSGTPASRISFATKTPGGDKVESHQWYLEDAGDLVVVIATVGAKDDEQAEEAFDLARRTKLEQPVLG